MKVLAVSGSLRRDSWNSKLLAAAADLVGDDVEFEIWDGLKALPPYDEDDDRPDGDPAVTRMREALAEADAVLFATPEYNSSIPGQLKNALDWMSRPLIASPVRNKPVAVVGASTGAFGAVWAQGELRKVLSAIGARVQDGALALGHAPTRFDEDGRLVDDDIRAELDEIVQGLVQAAHARREALAARA